VSDAYLDMMPAIEKFGPVAKAAGDAAWIAVQPVGKLYVESPDAARELLAAAYKALAILDPGAAADALVDLIESDALAVIRRRVAEAEVRLVSATNEDGSINPELLAILRGTPDDAPLEGCVRCGATGVPLRPLTMEPGSVCRSAWRCEERREAAAKAQRVPVAGDVL